jgi:hypothetical protein
MNALSNFLILTALVLFLGLTSKQYRRIIRNKVSIKIFVLLPIFLLILGVSISPEPDKEDNTRSTSTHSKTHDVTDVSLSPVPLDDSNVMCVDGTYLKVPENIKDRKNEQKIIKENCKEHSGFFDYTDHRATKARNTLNTDTRFEEYQKHKDEYIEQEKKIEEKKLEEEKKEIQAPISYTAFQALSGNTTLTSSSV